MHTLEQWGWALSGQVMRFFTASHHGKSRWTADILTVLCLMSVTTAHGAVFVLEDVGTRLRIHSRKVA